MNKKIFMITVLISTVIIACNKIDISYFEGFKKPVNFPESQYRFENNKITKEGFELGRKLFYDPILSANNTISCGSCHIQTSAFTHHGHSVSHGIEDRMGIRNSPPIMNLAWQTSFMWDGGIADLDLQSIAPITNHVEMDESLSNVIAKLQADKYYPTLFKRAFATDKITTSNFLKSLSQFMLMCVSSNSKYDSVMRADIGKKFTNEELKGYQLFQQKCAACHTEPLFTDNQFHNNGLTASTINDEGRFTVTQDNADRYLFKTPSLRNLSFTAPYMHDGRFLSIDAVLNHYDAGVQNTGTLDPHLMKDGKLGIAISGEEKVYLKTFLKTLDDPYFIKNQLLSEQ